MSEDAAVTAVAADTPALEVPPSVLEKLEPREYNAIRDAQEHEKKYPEPDDAEGNDPQKAKNGTPKWVQRRIDKLTARMRAAESQAAEAKAKLGGNGATHPDLSETVRKQDELIRSQHELLRTKEESERVDQEKMRSLQARSKAGIAALPDAEKIREGLTRANGLRPEVNHAVLSAIAEEANAVDIVAYLGRHPEEIAALHTLSASVAAARIGKISNQLEANARASREKPRPPDPISTVGGSSARSSIPMDELPMKDFIRIRNSQERARRI